jgi:hypothetical protein
MAKALLLRFVRCSNADTAPILERPRVWRPSLAQVGYAMPFSLL